VDFLLAPVSTKIKGDNSVELG